MLFLSSGMATAENLAAIAARGYTYIAERPRNTDLGVLFGDPERIGDPVDSCVSARKATLGSGSRVLYVRERRASGQVATDVLVEGRVSEMARKARLALASGKLSRPTRIHKGIKCTMAWAWSASLAVAARSPGAAWSSDSPDRCVLETNCPDLGAAELWERYTTLSRVEDGFRTLSAQLGLSAAPRPRSGRMVAQVFATLLAYRIASAVEHCLRAEGDNSNWATVRELLSTYTRHTVNLGDGGSRVFRLRVSDKPDPQHKAILDKLRVVDVTKLTPAGSVGAKARRP